jgi:ribosomal protein L11 methylase PrmA
MISQLIIASLPERTVEVSDELRAADAYRMAAEETTLLWRGDFQNAKHLLQAMKRRIQTPPTKASSAEQSFRRHRQAQAERARILGALIIPVKADFSIPLRRAPEVQQALAEALPVQQKDFYLRLRDILAFIGAHEWRKKGVFIETLNANIHPHYGVFSPGRGEYLKLISQTPLPGKDLAFDIGTGTGVIAAILARRGVQKIIATDMDERALTCAKENIERLQLQAQVEIQKENLFPQGKAALIVCNPPWIPEEPTSTLEGAIYDPNSQMLRGFLAGLKDHLTDDGEGWLIISDIAEHLGLRSREQLLSWIAAADLTVIDRIDTKPTHKKSKEVVDALSFARQKETTSLWRVRRTFFGSSAP